MKLKVSLAQFRVDNADPDENLRRGEEMTARAAAENSNLICFPEMWTTGFNWEANRRLLASSNEIIDRVGKMARRHHIWVGGSMLAPDEEGRPANTFILFNDEGTRAGTYRKVHLFSLLHEERHMAPGDELTLVDTPWGPMGLAVCYDIRFPELFRSYALLGARCVLSPMAFPHPRREHWRILIRARAIENQMFLIGVNQVGSENFGPDGEVTYFGTSAAIDPWGETLAEGTVDREELLSVVIDPEESEKIRAKMTVLGDRRPEVYRLQDFSPAPKK